MQQNIRVDVIYYLSPSDFEMEFNLCGCCHMRLLNEKTQDKQGLVKALAKAVSRSKVIIICGPLFDDNGLIKLVSTAIGKTTEVINNGDYGINYDDEISVIEGATPLVTPEGFFGGCIIESGPQAIIVLSESKGIRKTIMNNLVHQYIYELSLLPEDALTGTQHTQETEEVTEEAALEQAEEEIQQAEADETAEELLEESLEESGEENIEITEYEDISSASDGAEAEEITEEAVLENEPQAEDKPTEDKEVPFIIEETEEEADVGEESTQASLPEIEMYIDPQPFSPKKVSDYAKNYVPSEKDSLFFSGEEYDYDDDYDDEDGGSFMPLPKVKFSIIILVIILSLIAVVLLYLMIYIPYSKGIDLSTYVQQIFGPASNV